MNSDFKKYLLRATKASDCEEIEIIQSLWSGYGKISRYRLDGGQFNSVVVKLIAPSSAGQHPRGWNTDFSHKRKLKSYEVETNWYKDWSRLCNANCRIPQFIDSFSQGKDQWIIMEDLDTHFPKRRTQLGIEGVKACLKWLAHFHATFMEREPKGLWEVGTYWHLETRPDELEKMEHSELKNKASAIDDTLNRCVYKTLVHGDAKLANFCFSDDNQQVAAVDFQYVGGGCGMKDVAYFLGSCLSGKECAHYENELLDFYFMELLVALESTDFKGDFEELEREWRKMYAFAIADFTRFLLGWMPTHQKVNDYHLKLTNSVLAAI